MKQGTVLSPFLLMNSISISTAHGEYHSEPHPHPVGTRRIKPFLSDPQLLDQFGTKLRQGFYLIYFPRRMDQILVHKVKDEPELNNLYLSVT